MPLYKRVTCNFPSIFFAPQNKNENRAPPRHQGVDSPKPHCGPACFSSNFALFISIYGHIDMANKVSFGRRLAQLSTHFLFWGRVGEIHQFVQLPLCVVPKSCTHHLTHNNNKLLSHKEEKGENQQTARYVRAAPAGGEQTCTLVCLPGEWWQMSIHFRTASLTCALG